MALIFDGGAGTIRTSTEDYLGSIRRDLAKTSLQIAVESNRTAYNLNNSFIDQFESDSGIGSSTSAKKHTTTECIGPYGDATWDDSGAWTNTTADNWLVPQSFNSAGDGTFTNTNAYYSDGNGITLRSTTPLTFDGMVEVRATNGSDAYGPYLGFWTASLDIGTTPDDSVATATSGWRVGAWVSAGNWGAYGAFHVGAGTSWGYAQGSKMDGSGPYTLANSGSALQGANQLITITRDASGVFRAYAGSRETGTLVGASNGTDASGADVNETNTNTLALHAGGTGGWASSWSGLSYRLGNENPVSSGTSSVISTLNTASSSREKVSGVVTYKNVSGTATPGTDFKIYFTCDNGSSWTEAVSYTAGSDFSTGVKTVYLGETNCTAGTQVKYKAEFLGQTDGSLVTEIHGIGVNY